MQRIKILLDYLRAARDQQAFLIPASLNEQEIASLAAEARHYGLEALHGSLQAAAQSTKCGASCEHKHILMHAHCEQFDDTELQRLYKEGWELMKSNLSGCTDGTCGHLALWLILRRLR